MKWQVWHKRSDDYNQDENGNWFATGGYYTMFALDDDDEEYFGDNVRGDFWFKVGKTPIEAIDNAINLLREWGDEKDAEYLNTWKEEETMEKRRFWTVLGGKGQATEIYKSEPDDTLGFYGNEWEWYWHGYAGSREQAKFYAYEAMYEYINRKLED